MMEIVSTNEALRLVQRGVVADDEQVQASAESVLSYIVLHLKHSKVSLPAELKPHMSVLERHARYL